MSVNQKAILNALEVMKEKTKKKNFTQSIELILNLKDIDMKAPESRIREVVELPYSLPGKANKICIIASGELALKAKKEKVDLVIEKGELEAIGGQKKQKRKIANEYDFFIAEASLMASVGRIFGAFLGPKGKMPVPITPTVDVTNIIKKYRKTIIIRLRNQPVIHCRIGNEKMKTVEVVENILTVLRVLESKLKRGIKNIKSIYVKSTMGIPVKIQL